MITIETGWACPHGVAFDQFNGLWTVDPICSDLKHWSKHNGNLLKSLSRPQINWDWGSDGLSDTDVPPPRLPPWGEALALDIHGNLVIPEKPSTISILTPDGTPKFTFRHEEWLDPGGIAIDPNNGNIVVSNTPENRILIFNSKGEFIRKVGNQDLSRPRGIAIDDDSNIFVADSGNNRIRVFSEDGTLEMTKEYGHLSPAQGFLHNPYGIVVDRDGNVVVADQGFSRIVTFSKEGLFPTPTSGSKFQSHPIFSNASSRNPCRSSWLFSFLMQFPRGGETQKSFSLLQMHSDFHAIFPSDSILSKF